MPSRRAGREAALQALYSVAIGKRDAGEAVSELVGERTDSDYRVFVRDLVFGTIAFADQADTTYAPLLQGWTLERLPTIDRLLLRMGTFELRRHPEVPHAVVINETVELAKKFSTEESGRFINGVLSAVATSKA